MASYYLKSQVSDLSGGADFDREISADTETAGSITVQVANGAVEKSRSYTKPHKPSNADWETGSITAKVNVTTANSNIWLSVQAHRINKDGTIQESNQATGEQQLSTTGVKTFTMNSFNWSAGACDDRIRIDYIFRSAQSHGTAASVVIETGTTNTEVSTSISENAGTCRATFVKSLRQYKNDHKTIVAEGGNTGGDGISNQIYLDSLLSSWDRADKLIYKIENEPVGTSFDNVANFTGRQILFDPASPKISRSHTVVYDSFHKRMILFGGWDGTTRTNDVWELSLDDRFGSSPPQWRKLNPSGTKPSARTTHGAIYDADAKRMIVWGGYDGSDLGDTWELDLTIRYSEAWTQLTPSGTGPAARSQMMVAYKQATKKMYIFGGLVGAGDYRNDLFELDLTDGSEAWTQLKAEDAAGNPGSRADGVMVYDSGNNRLLIFSGYNGTNRLNDLWQWSIGSSAFSEVSDGTPPPVREFAVAVYDPNNNRVVVAGGRNGTASSNILEDAWELNTTSGSEAWTDRTPAAGERQSGVRSAYACFDSLNKLMVIFGGQDKSLEEEKHAKVIDLATAGSVPMYEFFQNNYLRERDAMGYAYNPDRDETLIVGGFARLAEGTIISGEHSNELWLYDHANGFWYQPVLNTQLGFTSREGVSAVYDTNRNRFIIFGGLTGNDVTNNVFYNDVWELKADANGVYTIKKLSPTGTKPSARWLHAAVYDQTNDRMVIFGGDDGSNFLNDVKALSFSGGENGAWSSITPTGTAPSARRQCAYAYDSNSNYMLITHGATGVNSFVGNTFLLDLTSGSEAWNSISPSGTAPDARRGMTAVYRSTDDKFYLFGGYDGTSHKNDLYSLTSTTTSPAWVTLSSTGAPSARRSHAAGYSPTQNKMVIYGGRADSDASFADSNNTYEYSVAGDSWAKKDPLIYIRGGVDVTGLSSNSFHWQSWVTGISGGDATKVSAFGNAESVADFITSVGQNFTQALNEIVAVADQVPKQAQKAANEVLLIVDSLARSTSRTFAEVVAIVDLISNQTQKIFSEIVAIGDSLIRQAQKNFAEIVAVADTLLTQSTLLKTFSEIVTIADSLSKQTIRSFSEVVAIVDSVTAKITAKIFEEAVVIADSIQRITIRTFTEVIAIVDTRVLQPIKSFVEAIVIADILSVVLTIKKELSEAVLLFDSSIRSIGKFMAPEIVLVADSTARLGGKNLQDAIITADSIAKESQRNILESVLVADTSIRQGIKTFGEAVTLADSFLRTSTLQRVFEEIVAVADTLSRQAQRAFSEAVAIADATIGKTISKFLSEAIVIADAIEKQISRIFSEIVAVTDSIARSAAKLLSDAVIIADIFSAVAVIKKELVEAVLLADSAIKSVTKSMVTEIVLVADNAARLAGKNLQDAVIVADSIVKETQRIILESILIVDTLFRQGIKTLVEAVTLVDDFLRTWTAQRIFEEIVVVTDSAIKQVQRLFSEMVAIVDSATKELSRIFSEIILIVEVLQRQAGKIISETIAIIDSVANQLISSRIFAEVVVIADSVLKQTGRTLAEVLTIADLVVRAPQKVLNEAVVIADAASKEVQRIFIEILTIADLLIKQVIRGFAESVVIADTAQAIKTFVRDLDEIIVIADSIIKTVSRSLAEVVAVTDSLIRSAAKLMNESIIVADTMIRQTARTLIEVIAIADSLIRQMSRVLIDAISIADSFTAKITAKIFAEAVIIADAIEKQTERILSEIVVIADSVIRQTGKFLGDSLTIADNFTRLITAQRILSEAIIIADITRNQAQKMFGEIIPIIDSLNRQVSRAFAEAVLIADSVSKTAQRVFQEIVSVADALIKTAGKALNEIVIIADSVLKQGIKTVSEIIVIADSVLKQGIKTLADTVLLADSTINQAGKKLSEAIAVFDVLFLQKYQIILSEIIAIADALAKTPQKIIQEAVAIGDAINKAISRAFSEIVAIADAVQKQAQRAFVEIVAVADSTRAIAEKVLKEAVLIMDAVLKIISFSRIYQETVMIADSALKMSARAFAEAVSIADSFAKLLTRYANLNEIVQIADSIGRAISKLIEEIIRITGFGDFKRLLTPGIKVVIQFIVAKVGILLMSAGSLIELKKEQKQTELASSKQDIALKSAETGVEVQGAKKDITLHGQH